MKLINADKVIKTLRARKKLFCKNQIEFSMLPPDQKARVDEIDTCIAELVNAEEVPPAQPERIRGRWIPVGGALYKCDKCGVVSLKRKFCSECGADMREVTT